MKKPSLVIEIKNRINRLMYRPPPHEIIQVQTYLHLLDVEHGMLVECLRRQEGRPTLHMVSIRRDHQWWDSVATPQLLGFASYVTDMMCDTDLQDAYLQSAPTKRKAMVTGAVRAYARQLALTSTLKVDT